MAAIPELDRSLESAYRDHSPALIRRARRWLPPDEAEDLVQETFLRAWMHHGGSNPGVPWMMTVLRNLAIDRSRRIHPQLIDDPASLEVGDGIDETAEKVVALEDRRRVRDALATLTTQQRAVITLREWAGMSQQEIAVSLGTTVPSVESLLLRGRRRLKKALSHALAAALWPTSEVWRKLKGIAVHPAAGSPGTVSGWSSTVASLATAATVVAAGAAAPLGAAGRDGPPPGDRTGVEASAGSWSGGGIETTPTERAAATGSGLSGGEGGGVAGAPASGSTASGDAGVSGTGSTSDGSSLSPKPNSRPNPTTTDGPNLESESDPSTTGSAPGGPQENGDSETKDESPETTSADSPGLTGVASPTKSPAANT